MPQWFGKPTPIKRSLGQVDSDDPTNLPSGSAAVCRNTEFTRDNGGVTCATTRAGVNLAIQGPNRAAITGMEGFVHQPQSAIDPYFERPLLFDYAGTLSYESPVGCGHSKSFPATAGGLTLPALSYMLGASAANRFYGAVSNLNTPTGPVATVDPKALTIWPIGMKPFGWRWQPQTLVRAGEVCTPATPPSGNGHTYVAQNAGTTGAVSPVFVLNNETEGHTYNDNGIIWKEYTMVLANRLPAPPAPVLALVSGGTFPANQTVCIYLTLTNGMGETVAGVLATITTTAASQAVLVTMPSAPAVGNPLPGWLTELASPYAITGVNVYEADVAAGNPLPALTSYQQAAAGVALGGNTTVTATAGSSIFAPTVSTARITPGQLPVPDTEPDSERDPLGGTFPAGQDVYTVMTYTNATGETSPGPASSVVDTNLNDAVQVTVAVPEDENSLPLFTIASVGIYEADVLTGTPAPPINAYQLVGYYQPGAVATIAATAAGPTSPTSNGTGPGGAIAADTTTGGIGESQGYRYGVVSLLNQNQYFSGFTAAAISKCIVDEDGWELGAFNIATGPANTIGRAVAFTVADGTPDGPFDWIGLVDILAPQVNWVYPATQLSGTVSETATLILDRVTTSATFNFDDQYLIAANDVTDRLQLMAPPEAVRVDFLDSNGVLALTGAPGNTGGGVLSIPGELESFRADTGPLPIVNNGEVCYGFTDKFKGGIYALCSGSGWAVTPNTASPSSWTATRRWGGEGPGGGKGPCGPKAWAACAKFLMFVDVSGIYKYEEGDDDLMSKEVPREWSQINWLARQTIEVYIDENTKQVLITVPTGVSTVPNMTIFLSYLEGWQNPIHFSTFSQNEITMEAARRYSFNDISANVIRRMKRTLPPGPAYVNGPDWNAMPDSSFTVTQLVYGSSAADGAVQARTPGVYNDNGNGIDWRYRTASVGMMQAVAKPEGFNLNATGMGRIGASFYAARDRDDGNGGTTKAIKVEDFVLTPDQHVGISRKVGVGPVDEYYSIEFTNYAQPDAWCSLKSMNVYVIPITAARGETEAGQTRG
jgi:hypothetical protein